MSGILYLVATPIGNLGDITVRALDVLRSVDAVACEDTRKTGKLLSHLKIKKRLVSYHDHNEFSRSKSIVDMLLSGKSIALVSDAGMPCISDPGYELVNAARNAGIVVTVLPGPTAFVSAAAVSGLPTDAIYFGGFLPAKTNARKNALLELKDLKATLVFYESPRRLVSSLRDCVSVFGARKGAVVRELTKLYEETVAGTLPELLERFLDSNVKGEIVLLVDRSEPENESPEADVETRLIELIAQYGNEGMDRRKALKSAAKECGLSKPEAYRIVEGRKKTIEN